MVISAKTRWMPLTKFAWTTFLTTSRWGARWTKPTWNLGIYSLKATVDNLLNVSNRVMLWLSTVRDQTRSRSRALCTLRTRTPTTRSARRSTHCMHSKSSSKGHMATMTLCPQFRLLQWSIQAKALTQTSARLDCPWQHLAVYAAPPQMPMQCCLLRKIAKKLGTVSHHQWLRCKEEANHSVRSWRVQMLFTRRDWIDCVNFSRTRFQKTAIDHHLSRKLAKLCKGRIYKTSKSMVQTKYHLTVKICWKSCKCLKINKT